MNQTVVSWCNRRNYYLLKNVNTVHRHKRYMNQTVMKFKAKYQNSEVFSVQCQLYHGAIGVITIY